MSHKLCYIEDNWAYFTKLPLDEQWGDDWDDAPYEHNAGEPYEHLGADIMKLAWEGDLDTPCGNYNNSPYSVQRINKGAVPWLVSSPWNKNIFVSIPGGTTMLDFITLVYASGGTVYERIS